MILGFLGTGHISSSVIEGIFKSKLKFKKIYLSPRNRVIAKKLSKRFKKIQISKNNQQLIDKSNWVFLAITPRVGKKILKDLYFKKNKKIISFISTINLKKLKENTKNKNITRVIPLPFIGMKKGPIVIFPPDKSVKNFFKHLGKVVEVKSEKVSKSFWATSSFMAPFYNLVSATSDWLTSKGVNRKEAEDYTRELFLALAEDAINKKKLSLKQLVVESQTPGGTNAFVLKELKKKKFYKVQQKVLNSIFKKF
ncbi:MAG: pyrroline-5-carboxylate reductase [Pelagibacterales bacterium MED-G40]|mgnify:FL=1|nr:MAG: pyrroline-5-carboxylate reductase [Pelagibacterales bacterium MED-G40]